MMKSSGRILQILFAVPWIVFGIQHFMYADFVAGLVPAYFPARIFWAYLTGAAMFAAGLSLILNRKAPLAAALLAAMLVIFILLIHIPKLAGTPAANDWTRALQDVAIAATCLMFAGNLTEPAEFENDFLRKIVQGSRFLFAALLITFGVQQFLDLDFLTAKVPAFLPWRMVWVYLTGSAMIAAGASVLVDQKVLTIMIGGAFLLLINLLNYGALLANDLHNPLYWTAAMLNLAINCGFFILAINNRKDLRGSPAIPE